MIKKAMALAAGLLLSCLGLSAQEKPVIKIDFNEASRKDAEVLEPGYTPWAVGKANTYSEKTVDNVTLILRSDGVRASWSKALVQAATDNSRFTMDGLTLEGDKTPGEYHLIIKGLPAGSHTLQTFHNDWADPAQYCGLPIHILVNGVEKAVVTRSWQKTSTGDAASTMLSFSVASEADSVVLHFYTDADDDFDNETGTQTKLSGSPLMNGFELNTIQITSQAKRPYPADLDLHADADEGSIVLSWSPASASVKRHHLYFGMDAAQVEAADTSSALYVGARPYADTTYFKAPVSNRQIYYWRVDEEDEEGMVTPGSVWTFRPRHLAFPGAEGYGRFANGGRDGKVVYVTNLNNNGPGSLREAATSQDGPRTILFAVSGIIDMNLNRLKVDDDVTIAGQTAPGKGICLYHCDVALGNDNVCRHIRFRRGYSEWEARGNAMGIRGCNHTITDHISTSWGTDETVSGREAKNVSFQYSNITEPLGINHGFAASIAGNIGSYHHNLIANSSGRNWDMAHNYIVNKLDLFNNVVYNWWKRTTDGNADQVNFVNNVYKMGEDTRTTRLFEMQYQNLGTMLFYAYVSGNIRINKDGSVTEDKKGDTYAIDVDDGITIDYETFVDEPFFPSYATIHSARDAYKIVLSDNGANMPVYDDHDKRIVREAVTGGWTYTGSFKGSGYKGQIDMEDDAGGIEIYPEVSLPADFDSDLDGLPDWWEKMFGTNPESPAGDFSDSNDDSDGDGYTALEDYLDFLAHPNVIFQPGEENILNVKQFFEGFTANPVYTLIGEPGEDFDCRIEDSTLVVKTALNAESLVRLGLKVIDSEGSSYVRQLCLAVTPLKPVLTAQEQLHVSESAELEVVEIYCPDGVLIKKMPGQGRCIEAQDFSDLDSGLWLIRATDTQGRHFGYKILIR